MDRISGRDFDIMLGDYLVHVDTATLDITDNSGVAMDNGVPNGSVSGDVSAAGELVLDSANLAVVLSAAESAGSFQGMDLFDMVFMGKTLDNELRIEAFGCRLKISKLLDVDSKGGSTHKTTLPFNVTDPSFVKINGVPYLPNSAIQNLK
jgi:hypothetical protein